MGGGGGGGYRGIEREHWPVMGNEMNQELARNN